MKKIEINKKLILISLIFIFFLILFIMFYVPLVGVDDYRATVNMDNEKITLFYLISRSFSHCISWNARLGEFIYFFIGLFPKIIHNLLNSCFFVIFILLILKYAFDYEDIKEKSKKNLWLLSIIIVCIVFIIEPTLWNNFFWMAGSCNHLWGLCILILTFLPFRKFFLKSYKIAGLKLVLYCITSFIAGTVSENIVPFIVGTIILIIGYKYIKEKKIYLWSVLSLISFILGYIWLMFNPSTWTRYDFYTTLERLPSFKNGNLFSTFFNDYKYYFIFVFILIIIYIIKSIILKEKILKKSFFYNLIFYLLSFISFLILIFSPYYNARALLIISFTSIIMIVYLINEFIYFKNIIINGVIALILVIVVFYYTNSFITVYKDYIAFSAIRDKFVYDQLEQENASIIFPYYDKYTDKRIFEMIDDQLCNYEPVKHYYNIEDNIHVVCGQDVKIR